MPAKTKGAASTKAGAKPGVAKHAVGAATTSDGVHPAELEGFAAELKLKSSTPEGRSRLAVLHAVRQAVVERGGAPSCTAYAGALLSSLGQKQDEETTASVVYVLGHVLQHVGPGLLRGKFVPLADVLVATGKSHPDSAPVARHTLQCIYMAVKEQEGVAWRTPQMNVLCDILVSTATDPRPKVRKAAQSCLVQLMTEPSPAGELARTFLEGKIVSMSTATFRACTSTNTTESQQLLGMLRDISSGLSAKALQALAQPVLKLLANDERTMVGQIFTTLDSFLQHDCGSSKAVSKMISTALENQPPASAGMEPINAFITFLKTLLHKLQATDPGACAAKVPDAFASLSDYLLPQEKSDELAVAAGNAICDIIDACIKEPMIQEAYLAAQSSAKTRAPTTPLEAVAGHAVVLLQPRFKRNWHCSLAIVQSLLNRLGARCSPVMDGAVAALIDLHPRLPSMKGASPRTPEELELAIGAAIVKMGPGRFLEVAPLLSDAASEGLEIAHPGNRLWLLPLLKRFVRGAPLAYFIRSLLPLADKLQSAAVAADGNDLPVEAKNLMHVNSQVWGLLPAFCLECTDLPEAFAHIARRMGTCIESEPDLRNIVCSALLNAIRSMRRSADTDHSMGDEDTLVSPDLAARSTAALAGFAKNFLPILFNAASTAPVNERPLLLEVISEYAQIAEPTRLTALFQNVMKKLLTAAAGEDEMTDEAESETSKILLLDLALSLMPALDTANAEFLYKSAIPFVADASGGVQKRSYKLLQLMSQAHTGLMQSRLGHVQDAMVEALPGLLPAAGKWRLRCIAKLVEHLPYDAAYMQLIGAIIGEVILGTKSAARKTREVSFAVLVTVAQKVDAGSSGQQLGDFFTMLLAGLAGTTAQMVSATVYSLSRLVYEYADRVGQLAPPLLESVMLLFQHKSREIVTAALGFAKVAVVSLSPELLRRYMKSFIANLLLWSGDTRNRFRLKVKVVLERLMRRTSYEEVLEATPEEHRRLIGAVYKRWKRSKTLKARTKADGLEAGEGDEGEEGEGSRMRLKGGYEAALYGDEDSEEEADDADGDAEMAGGVHTGGAGRRGLDGGRHSGAAGAAKAGGATPGPATKFGFPATSGPDGKPVILEEAEESGVGRKRRRQEEDAQEVMAVRYAQDKEAREDEAVRQTGIIHSDSVALAEGAESAAAARGQRSWDQAPQGKKRRKIQPESKVLGGTEYQHKTPGTGGDIKKAGRPDPFAYVPFDKRQINKKKSHQPVKSLKKVFNATRDTRMGASQKAGGRKTRKKKK